MAMDHINLWEANLDAICLTFDHNFNTCEPSLLRHRRPLERRGEATQVYEKAKRTMNCWKQQIEILPSATYSATDENQLVKFPKVQEIA